MKMSGSFTIGGVVIICAIIALVIVICGFITAIVWNFLLNGVFGLPAITWVHGVIINAIWGAIAASLKGS